MQMKLSFADFSDPVGRLRAEAEKEEAEENYGEASWPAVLPALRRRSSKAPAKSPRC